MTKDEFEAWKDSAATRWVLAQLQGKVTARQIALHERLMTGALLTPPEWAALQAGARYDIGYTKAIEELVQLEHEDVADTEQGK